MHELKFYFGGTCSADVGLYQLSPVRYTAPEPVFEQVDVPGRSGPVLFYTGAYKPVTATVECCILRRKAPDLVLSAVNRFLFSTLGYQRFEDPLVPEHFRQAVCTTGAEYYQAARSYAPFTLQFLCKPQKWRKDGEQTYTFTASGATLVNPTGFNALPLITVYGSGEATFKVTGDAVGFTADFTDHCTLDCDLQAAYRNTLIVFAGIVYHIADRPVLDGSTADVYLSEADIGDELRKLGEINGIDFVTLTEAGNIDAATAAEHADLFAEWANPVAYTVGQVRRYQGALYKCIQAHTSQESWAPDTATSLWSLTADPAEEWPEWSQPISAQDTYASGAKVSHNAKHWTSTVANNVWEPGVYGWAEVTDDAAE